LNYEKFKAYILRYRTSDLVLRYRTLDLVPVISQSSGPKKF